MTESEQGELLELALECAFDGNGPPNREAFKDLLQWLTRREAALMSKLERARRSLVEAKASGPLLKRLEFVLRTLDEVLEGAESGSRKLSE